MGSAGEPASPLHVGVTTCGTARARGWLSLYPLSAARQARKMPTQLQSALRLDPWYPGSTLSPPVELSDLPMLI